MEPVFMVMGQSAATAAVHAINEQTSVQGIDPEKLQKQLAEFNERIRAVIGGAIPYEGIARLLDGAGADELEQMIRLAEEITQRGGKPEPSRATKLPPRQRGRVQQPRQQHSGACTRQAEAVRRGGEKTISQSGGQSQGDACGIGAG